MKSCRAAGPLCSWSLGMDEAHGCSATCVCACVLVCVCVGWWLHEHSGVSMRAHRGRISRCYCEWASPAGPRRCWQLFGVIYFIIYLFSHRGRVACAATLARRSRLHIHGGPPPPPHGTIINIHSGVTWKAGESSLTAAFNYSAASFHMHE